MSVNAVYFSPTGNTKKVCCKIAETMADILHTDFIKKDLTRPAGRKRSLVFKEDDIVIVGAPVYGGRIPSMVLPALNQIKSSGAYAVAVVTYGNRDYDDALLELSDLLKKNFEVLGAGAFVGQHSYVVRVGEGRPDQNDLLEATEFAKKLANKISLNHFPDFDIKGNPEYKAYGKSIIVKALITNDSCTRCGICSNLCPTGAISTTDQHQIDLTQCIKCHACVRNCPVMAKHFEDENLDHVREWLSDNFMQKQDNQLFH